MLLFDHKIYPLPYKPITEDFKTIHSLNSGILISFYKILCMKNLPEKKKNHFIPLSTQEFFDENTWNHLGNTGVPNLKGSRFSERNSLFPSWNYRQWFGIWLVPLPPPLSWKRIRKRGETGLGDFHKKGSFEIYYSERSMWVMVWSISRIKEGKIGFKLSFTVSKGFWIRRTVIGPGILME